MNERCLDCRYVIFRHTPGEIMLACKIRNEDGIDCVDFEPKEAGMDDQAN